MGFKWTLLAEKGNGSSGRKNGNATETAKSRDFASGKVDKHPNSEDKSAIRFLLTSKGLLP